MNIRAMAAPFGGYTDSRLFRLGIGLRRTLDYSEQLLFVLAVWVVQLLVSPFWLARFRFGPAEWAWRSLTYWQRQPLRRRMTGPAAIRRMPADA